MSSRFFKLLVLPVCFYSLAACDADDIPGANGYAAKDICSRVFVQGDNFRRVRDEYVTPVVTPYEEHWNIQIDYDRQTVQVRDVYFLKPKARAIYRDGLGCTLVADVRERKIRRQSFVPLTAPTLPYDEYWPSGSAGIDPTPVPGVDYSRIDRTLSDLLVPKGDDRPLAALVAYDGQLIAEQYQTGYDHSSLMTSWSMIKSISGLLMGILYGDGHFEINDPAPVPAWNGTAKGAITVKNLMQMAAGLEWVESYTGGGSAAEMLFLEGDMGAYVESLPLESTPGTVFDYSTGTAMLLGDIVTRLSGGSVQSAHDFYQQRLFYPLGITNGLIEFDASGTLVGGAYAHMKTRDYARLGQLVLQNGNWDGQQVVPADWIDFMTTPSDAASHYGGQVWLYNPSTMSEYNIPDDIVTFRGFLGQRVAIIPSRKLVMVRTGVYHSSNEEMDPEFYAALEQVLNALP